MSGWLQQLRSALRVVADSTVLVCCWGLWVALAVVFALQVAITFSREVAAPGFLLRAFERRLNASHVDARFGRATFNPTGGILIQDVQLSLPGFGEPIAHASAAYIQLDPWALLLGEFEPRRIHMTGVRLFMPAMLAPSGRSEEIVESLDFTVGARNGLIEIEHLAGKIAGVAVQVHGALRPLQKKSAGGDRPLPLFEHLASNYAPAMRQLIRVSDYLKIVEQPRLGITLTPSGAQTTVADITLTAARMHPPAAGSVAVTTGALTASTQLILNRKGPSESAISVTTDVVRAGELAVAESVHADLRGTLELSTFAFKPKEIEFTTDEILAHGFAVQNISGRIVPESLSKLSVDLVLESLAAGASIQSEVDLAAQSAIVRFSGTLSPKLLDPIGGVLELDLHRFIGFGSPLRLDADARFGSGWKFSGISGHLAVQAVDAYHVPIDVAHGEIEFDGRHFLAHHAKATLGDNFATGSFYQDLATREFRFLLEGRLRPLAISGWFREWWPNFFEAFEFPIVPPEASVDVAGRWFSGPETTVFLFADSASPVVRGVHFDQARTLMFIRPHFIDGLETFGTRGAGDVRGTFVRRVNPESGDWSELSLAFTSTLDVEGGAKLLGSTIGAELNPYWFERSPTVEVDAKFHGPGATGGAHQSLKIRARSTGAFTAYQFPGRNLSFAATLTDDDVVLEDVKADVANGHLSGRALISGSKAERRLGFDAELRHANLAEAVTAAVNFAARRRGEAQTTPEKILPGKSDVTLDLAVSADGMFDDPYSFQGNGNASLAGASLGEIRLLGLLSELLNFTALRFTAARADFRVMGSKISFPSVSITGATSAIEGHGDYALDRKLLDFNARVYPFQESKSLLQSAVGVVLSPLSAVLEVKLTGPLEQPNWAFVIGPTNFFRTLSQSGETAEPLKPAPATPIPARNP